MRTISLAQDEVYHVFNRGVDKRKIFPHRCDYVRFVRTMHNVLFFGTATVKKPLLQKEIIPHPVDILAYCLMPNHYHLLLRSKTTDGITSFMHKIDTSYTKYFNLNNKRTGRLFEYTFKAKHIDTDELFVHVCRYIHLNPLIAGLTQNLNRYQWSSYPDVIGKRQGTLCINDEILSFFNSNPISYQEFVHNQAAYARTLHQTQNAGDENMLYL
jgi:putative transposase